jgi:hypothetical protein
VIFAPRSHGTGCGQGAATRALRTHPPWALGAVGSQPSTPTTTPTSALNRSRSWHLLGTRHHRADPVAENEQWSSTSAARHAGSGQSWAPCICASDAAPRSSCPTVVVLMRLLPCHHRSMLSHRLSHRLSSTRLLVGRSAFASSDLQEPSKPAHVRSTCWSAAAA